MNNYNSQKKADFVESNSFSLVSHKKTLALTNTLAYHKICKSLISNVFIVLSIGACTIKHYGPVIYIFYWMLMCLSLTIYKTQAYFRIHTILIHNIFIIQSPGPALQKHYVYVIYRFCSKLVCLSKSMCLWLTIYKTLASYRIHTILSCNVL